jgi:hypothetical protein
MQFFWLNREPIGMYSQAAIQHQKGGERLKGKNASPRRLLEPRPGRLKGERLKARVRSGIGPGQV